MKKSLTAAQLSSQQDWKNVDVLQQLEMGDIVKSSNIFIGRASGSPSPSFPNVTLVKHFFSRHLLIEARVSNSSFDARTLGNVAFVVAESADETGRLLYKLLEDLCKFHLY